MGDFDDGFNEHDVQGRPIKAYKNGCFENHKTLFVQPHWTWDDFLCSCSQRLEMVPMASRVFNSDGVEVDDLMCIEEGDMLFFSTGAPFQIPGQTEAEASSVDNIGSGGVVGGYRVTTLLGRGGFGEVRLGVHQLTNEKVALKFILKSEMGSLGDVERTTTEIQCLTALNHPSIIKLIRVFNEPNHVVLVFELLDGGDLYHHLVHLPSGAGLVEEEGALVFSQILSGVGYAHNQHICHRDLKLENILLQNDLNSVKIADFGLSDFYRPGAMAKTTCGSISYLPPEVFRGTSNAGPPLDVWSLGVILFAIVCGRLPFEGSDLRGTNRPRENVIRNRIMRAQYKLDETLSPEVTDLITRMLQPDPVERATIPEIFSHPWLRGKASYSSMESLMAASPSKDGDDDDDAEAFTLQIAKPTTDAAIPQTTPCTTTADESSSVDESNKLPKAAVRTTSNPLVPTLSGLSTPPSSTLVMTPHAAGHHRGGRTLRTGDAKPPHHTRSPRPASTTPVTIPALNTNALVMPKVTPAEKAINCLTPTHSAKRMPPTHSPLSVCPKSPKPTAATDKLGRPRRDERPPPIHPMDDRAGTAAKAKRRGMEHSSSDPHGKTIVDSITATTLEPIG
ncbi:CAMK/CAMKL protein kinase [Saprolegnia parasitica CBS 223.65]|uniref:CAMK/CAMKL protein kinase n=1 Tax=Saprolegnia parasitica (strain CBS 223.65) TaxID=695850 RepID=A0A067CT51_SAPPC|nr:CAMK/CAMKL protein kinase [Saprolegnia parasitica CBS 223.65]KDO33668.1 CAMK/CAMKL protein kinase [Saprolegnia parasitica CBS 223.65]|eukprot:XP_012195696.1 CAMK/CAMKL protein kinase [Saprolegnia parasitica CBS 223.65]